MCSKGREDLPDVQGPGRADEGVPDGRDLFVADGLLAPLCLCALPGGSGSGRSTAISLTQKPAPGIHLRFTEGHG